MSYFHILLMRGININSQNPSAVTCPVGSKTIATLLSTQRPQSKKLKGSSESHSPHGTRDSVQWACIGHQPGSPWLVIPHYGNKVFIGAIQQKGRKSKLKTTRSVTGDCWMISWKQWRGTRQSLKCWCQCIKKSNKGDFHTVSTWRTLARPQWSLGAQKQKT